MTRISRPLLLLLAVLLLVPLSNALLFASPTLPSQTDNAPDDQWASLAAWQLVWALGWIEIKDQSIAWLTEPLPPPDPVIRHEPLLKSEQDSFYPPGLDVLATAALRDQRCCQATVTSQFDGGAKRSASRTRWLPAIQHPPGRISLLA